MSRYLELSSILRIVIFAALLVVTARDYKEIKIKIKEANDEFLRKKANAFSSQEDFREHLRQRLLY
jgi:hypothetical protein